jgi:hypothetical protein
MAPPTQPSAFAWSRRRQAPNLLALFAVEVVLRVVAIASLPLLIVLLVYNAASAPATPLFELRGLSPTFRDFWRYALVPLVCLVLIHYPILALLGASESLQRFLVFGCEQGALESALMRRSRGYAEPRLLGLRAACRVQLRSEDGVRLCAWHAQPLPAPGTDHGPLLETTTAASPAVDSAAIYPALDGTDSAGAAVEASFSSSFDVALREAAASCASGPCAALVLHGMGETRTKWSVVAHAKLVSERLGLHALVLEYRGYGDSDGVASEQGLYADGRAVRPCELTSSAGANPPLCMTHCPISSH